MEKVSVLNNFTFLFQFLGLQTFSLKILSEKTRSKYPSKIFCGFVIFWIFMALMFFVFVFEEFLYDTNESRNSLEIVFSFFNNLNYSSSILIGAVLTFVNHSKLVEFFQKSEEISKLFDRVFGFRIKFSEIKENLIVCYCFNLVYILIMPFYVSSLIDGFDIYDHLIKPILWMIIKIHIQMIVMRFFLYVQVVNFLLENLIKAVAESFIIHQNQILHSNEKNAWKFFSPKVCDKQKIVTIRKIYLLIREMVKIINDSMGFVILLRILLGTAHMIISGHTILSDIHGTFSTWSNILRWLSF